MKKIIFLMILLLIVVGCNQKDIVDINRDATLLIKGKMGNEFNDNYEIINEINDKHTIKTIADILNKASWQTNIDVDMPRDPDYKINNNVEIWISTNGNRLEIVYTENSYYVRLPENKSSELFKIIVGREL